MRKKRKYTLTKVIDTDDIYGLLNKVQLKKKRVKFSVSPDNASMIENLIRDAGLTCNKKLLKKKITLIVSPKEDEDEKVEKKFDMEFFNEDAEEDGRSF